MKNKYLVLKLTIIFFSFASTTFADVYTFISAEVGNNNTNSRFHTEVLQNEWRNRATELVGACEGSFVPGDLSTAVIDGVNTNEMSLTFSGVDVTLSNRDMDGPLMGSAGGDVSLSTSSTLQDGSPRPENFYNTSGHPSYYSELTGSGATRNALLVSFDQPLLAFGIWLGDLETNSLGIEAYVRFFDNTGTQIGSDTAIPSSDQWLSSEGITEATCGGALRGCGNRTSRFVGFVADEDTPVTSMLVVVGDDDIGGAGETEHISAIAPTFPIDFSCGDANLEISKFAIDKVSLGNNLLYTIVVSNHGPADASNTIVTDSLPAGVDFVSAMVSDGSLCTEVSGTVTCDLGIFVSGDSSKVIEIEVTPNSEGLISNTVSVFADENDPDNSDNMASVDTTVSADTSSLTPVICEASDLTSTHFVIDGSAASLLQHINSSASFLRKRKKNGKCLASEVKNLNNLTNDANETYAEIWEAAWKDLPQTDYSCNADVTSFCSTVNTAITLENLRQKLQSLKSISQEILSKECLKGTEKRNQLLKKVRTSFNSAITNIESFASEVQSCEF